MNPPPALKGGRSPILVPADPAGRRIHTECCRRNAYVIDAGTIGDRRLDHARHAKSSSGITGAYSTAMDAARVANPPLTILLAHGFSATSDTRDGVHPNTSGSQKMATRWYDALTTNQLVR